MKIFIVLLMAIVFLSGFKSFAYSILCDQILATALNNPDSTEGFISYLSILYEKQVVSKADLIKFKNSLESRVITNPISEQQAQTQSAAQPHRENIESYIKQNQLNQERLLKWVIAFLDEVTHTKSKRNKSEEKTHAAIVEIKFVQLPKGNFLMGVNEEKTPAAITYPFEIMSTLVTQSHWIDIMKKNPSHFKLTPNHPVENITWWSAAEFANRLSKKMELPPVYDFSEINFDETTHAEDGTLKTLKGDTGEVKINAPNGDIYQAVGLRLPTNVEYEYALRKAGTSNDLYSFGNDDHALKYHAWYAENSANSTHPVADLLPITIGDKEIYDLIGNVMEWTHDTYLTRPRRGDPLMRTEAGHSRGLRGGNYSSGPIMLHSSMWNTLMADDRGDTVGFRLVRTLRKTQDGNQ